MAHLFFKEFEVGSAFILDIATVVALIIPRALAFPFFYLLFIVVVIIIFIEGEIPFSGGFLPVCLMSAVVHAPPRYVFLTF